jgi:hypothetical protein
MPRQGLTGNGNIRASNILLKTLVSILSSTAATGTPATEKQKWMLEEFSFSLAAFLKSIKGSRQNQTSAHACNTVCMDYFRGVCSMIESGLDEILAVEDEERNQSLQRIQQMGVTANIQHTFERHLLGEMMGTQASANLTQAGSRRLSIMSTQDVPVTVRLLFQALVSASSSSTDRDRQMLATYRNRTGLVLSTFKSLENCNEQLQLYSTLREKLGENADEFGNYLWLLVHITLL